MRSATRAEAAVKGGAKLVIVGGGDGSVSSAAQALAGSKATLGILPLGTLNHLARDLGIPPDLKQSAKLIASGQARPIDVAEVNGRTFVNNAAIGLYPLMVVDRESQQQRLGRSKRLAMLVASLRTLANFHQQRLTLSADGGAARVDTPLLFVGNNDYRLALPTAGQRDRIDDGRLCVMLMRKKHVPGFLAAVARALLGIPRADDMVKLDDVRQLRVDSQRGMIDLALDGETVSMKPPLDFAIRPGALQSSRPLTSLRAERSNLVMKVWIAASLSLLAMTGCASVPKPNPDGPARVAVAFDRSGERGAWADGLADPSTGRAVTLDDPVRIASVSKLVVAIGVMRLVEQGKLDLDRDVAAYLGWNLRNPAFPDRPITLRQLLSHTSGLRDGDDAYVVPLGGSLQQALADPAVWDSGHGPGDGYFAYANFNFPVIASVMEKASGERFDLLMKRLVLGPMNLDACFNWPTCSDAAVGPRRGADAGRQAGARRSWRQAPALPRIRQGRRRLRPRPLAARRKWRALLAAGRPPHLRPRPRPRRPDAAQWRHDRRGPDPLAAIG